MKVLCIFLGLCVAVCGSSANAGFLSTFTNTVSTGTGRSVQYTVWENTTGVSAQVTGLTGSPSIAAGSFAYLYQVLAPASPSVNSFRVQAERSLIASAGVIADQAFTGSTTFGLDSTLRVTTLMYPGSLSRFIIEPNSVNDNANRQSYLMYIVSDYAPTIGKVRLANGGNQDNNIDRLDAPVPVPLPASLALFGLGLPLVRTLRRKLSR